MSILRSLVRRSDVLIDNFSPRVLENWRLDDTSLRRLNPNLTIVHLSGFGHSGAQRDFVSYGPTLQAQLGFTAHMRHRRGKPAGFGYSYSDLVSGYAAALAVLRALQGGFASTTDLAQLEILASTIGGEIDAAAAGIDAEALGNECQEGEHAPHGVYRCLDDEAGGERWLAVAVVNDSQWRAMALCIDEDWALEARFDAASSRFENRREIDALLADWTKQFEVDEVVARLQKHAVPCAVVANAVDLESDEHLQQRGMWQCLTTAECTPVTLDRSPLLLSRTPSKIDAAAPLLGEHTKVVLESILGMTSEQVQRLVGDGVVA